MFIQVGPFETLINPNRKKLIDVEQGVGFGDPQLQPPSTLGSIKSLMNEKINSAENFVESKAKHLKIGNLKWISMIKIAALVYAPLSLLSAYAREDFLNVTKHFLYL